MIEYSNEEWFICMVCKIEGSVMGKAFLFAFSNALLAATMHWASRELAGVVDEVDSDGNNVIMGQMEGAPILWSGYTAVLGFLVVFRNNQAYARFWEGATLVNQIRGEWFNSTSALMAFCNRDPQHEAQVDDFQQLLVRLMSVLYCSALQQICELNEDDLEVLDLTSIDEESLRFLEEVPDRCQIIIQWIQRLIMYAYEAGTLKADAPILSRTFQELSRGMVNLNNVRKIKDIPFPYPYQQMVILMLFVHYLVTPIIAALYVASPWWAAIICFFVTGGFWSVIYIAAEIDQPFGDDPNDLPLIEMQATFNASLKALLDSGAQVPPRLTNGKSRTGNGTDKPSKAKEEASKNQTGAASEKQSGNESGKGHVHDLRDVSDKSGNALTIVIPDTLVQKMAELEQMQGSVLEDHIPVQFTRAISSASQFETDATKSRSKDMVGRQEFKRSSTVEMEPGGSVSPPSSPKYADNFRAARARKRTIPLGGRLGSTWRQIHQSDQQSTVSSEHDPHNFQDRDLGLPGDGAPPEIPATTQVLMEFVAEDGTGARPSRA